MVLRSIHLFAISLLVAGCFTFIQDASAASSGGTLSFAASNYSGNENGGSVTVSVKRTGGSSGAASIDYLTSGNTALLNVNYVHTAGKLTWANGDSSSKSIKIPLINGSAYSGTKTFHITLSHAAGAAAASPSVATLIITGDAATGGSLAFAASTYTVAQQTASVTVSVTRTGGSAGTASVAYNTSGNTALLGVDYVHTAGTLDWAAGDTAPKKITVPLMSRSAYSGTKSFYLTLSKADGALSGSPNVATLSITGASSVGTGAGSAGVIELSNTAYSVAQKAGSVSVSVNRTGGSSGAASVGYATANSSAIAGKDYTAETGQLKWASGDTSSKTFNVAVSAAAPFTGSKTFAVALASASGAPLGSPASGMVTISGAAGSASGTATLSWIAPTQNTNGTPLTNLAGYRISYGTNPSSLSSVISISSATTKSYEITNLAAGTYYFTVQAYNSVGGDSGTSNSASKTI